MVGCVQCRLGELLGVVVSLINTERTRMCDGNLGVVGLFGVFFVVSKKRKKL